MKKPTIIFDLDGTLANIDKRRTKATKADGKINWKIFFAPENIELDEPIEAVIKTFQALKQTGFRVGIFSGRDVISKKETELWLSKYGVEFDFLRMRPHGDFTPDDKLKKFWLDVEISAGNEIMCVYDDRDKVVKMWRENGVACFQVAPGDF